jgi:uncharacterized protein
MNSTSRKLEILTSIATNEEPIHTKSYSITSYITHSRGSSWIHNSLAIIKTDETHFAVVARDTIIEGTTLVVFGGRVITVAEFENLSSEMQRYPYQISSDLFLSPIDLLDIGLAERINHSCSPNAGFAGSIHLIAIPDIQVGEEVTFDYATCVSTNDDAFKMQCFCGAPSCRGTITGQDWQLKEVQSRLLPYYQPYLQERVRARRKRERFLR